MFKHLLLPLDFTDKNDAAVDVATELAGLQSGRVTLLHVIETIEGVPDDEMHDFYEVLEERARTVLARLQTDLDHRHLATETAVAFGNRAEEIVRFAAEEGVDLIVLSSRPIEPGSEVPRPWPTISHKVAILAHCPVLLVR